jgi:hypothetical protein
MMGRERMNCKPVIAVLLMLLLTVVLNSASQAAAPFGRSTNDRYADLIDALIRGSRFDDAIEVCQAQLKAAQPQSDSFARWTIRHSQVLAGRQMGLATFSAEDAAAIETPVADLLASYPNHERKLFLQAQRIAIQRDAARHSVLRAVVAPNDETTNEAATRLLLRATTASLELSEQVGQRRTELETSVQSSTTRPHARNFALAEDMLRLQQELQVDAVSLALMQTELFARGSTDYIAAAAQAEQAAIEALTKIPSDTPARREVERLKVEAIFRAGQLKRAEEELAALVRLFTTAVPARVIAMSVQLHLANQQMDQAQTLLSAYYGTTPLQAPPSIEMDLARLDFLMQSNQPAEVGNWLESIEQRGGAYARRRAEAISLASLRATPRSEDDGGPMVDPAIVAAQGQDWLRRGEPGRAGELLAAAAAAEPNADRAIKRALEAAAAFQAAGRTLDAVDVLTEVPIAKATGASAANAHLQAALLYSETPLTDTASRIESLLRDHLKQWPAEETANSARQWLIKIVTSQHRSLEAAEIASSIPATTITPEDLAAAIKLWQTAFLNCHEDQYADVAARFQKSFERLRAQDKFRGDYTRAAALLLDRGSIADLSIDPSQDRFVADFLMFRQQGKAPESLSAPAAELATLAIWRLMRDGRAYPRLRPATQHGGDGWTESWVGPAKSGQLIKVAATLLANSDAPAAQQAAIAFWDRLAAGTVAESSLWHEAKTAAIMLLAKTGKRDEAVRRAKYILLTAAGLDEHWKQQYESLSQL